MRAHSDIYCYSVGEVGVDLDKLDHRMSVRGEPVPAPPGEGKAGDSHQQHASHDGRQPGAAKEAGAVVRGNGGSLRGLGRFGDGLVPV